MMAHIAGITLDTTRTRQLNSSDMASLRGSLNYVWDISKPLGQGATSMVYIGREKRTGEEVAVKVFTPQSFQRPQQVQMREFEVMKRLNHENIVRLLAIEEEQTMQSTGSVIVMELCSHGSLYNLLDSPENSFGLCEEEFLLVLKQIAAGVKHLRDHDIIHRDIKPGNILRCVAEDGRSVYKLTDFGAARELQENEEFMSLYGTEEYLHPDMYERAVLRHHRGQQFGVHVDLWSLGVTFYHAATGSLPFRPYGGRRNKETMHLITAQKEQGVISGVQLTENGAIEWRRELPTTCKLSLGLKKLITPFLAALLEKDPACTWPFEQFFEQVAIITSKTIVDVFCPSVLSFLKIYANKDDTLQKFQELISEQTNIAASEQLLLCNGQILSSLIQPSQQVSTYCLDVSPANPVIVYNTSAVFPQQSYLPSVGTFPQMSASVTLDHDYPQCKRCCGVLHTIQDAVRSNSETTVLQNLAVHMYCANLKRQMETLQEGLSRISQQMQVIGQWQQSLFSQQHHHVDMLSLHLIVSSTLSLKVSSWLKVIQATQQTARRDCEELLEKLHVLNERVQAQHTEVAKALKSTSDWNPALACVPSDRCTEKVKVMLERMKKILVMFKENRNKRVLNYNDEQIHKFEKNKLSELCTKARSLWIDHCVTCRKVLYDSYKGWFHMAIHCQELINQLAKTMGQMTEQHIQLFNRLKGAETQCSKLIDDCVEHLKKEIAAVGIPTFPNAFKPVNGFTAEKTVNGSRDSSIEFVNALPSSSSSTSSRNSSMSSRQERLDSLLDGIHNSRQSLEELEMLVHENTQLIFNFGILTSDGKGLNENGL